LAATILTEELYHAAGEDLVRAFISIALTAAADAANYDGTYVGTSAKFSGTSTVIVGR
jgi:hypothetical protein